VEFNGRKILEVPNLRTFMAAKIKSLKYHAAAARSSNPQNHTLSPCTRKPMAASALSELCSPNKPKPKKKTRISQFYFFSEMLKANIGGSANQVI
jgi:hypothetical protein